MQSLLYKWKDQQEAQASGTALSTDEREELKNCGQGHAVTAD